MEDCGQGPGLGQITVSLTTIIPVRTLVPPSTPRPIRTSTPTVLNCSALTPTCHLPSLPHCAESTLTSHITPYPSTGRTHRKTQRQADKQRTTPTHTLSLSVQCLVMSLSMSQTCLRLVNAPHLPWRYLHHGFDHDV